MLPRPTNFAEGQRALALWLASAAGVFCGLCSVALVLLLWLGGWTVETEGQRLTILAVGFVGFLSGMTAVIIGLLVGGPVGRFKAGVSRDGATFETEDKE